MTGMDDKRIAGEKALPQRLSFPRRAMRIIRKFWLTLLVAALVLGNFGYERYLWRQEFPAQEVLTEAEFRQLVQWAEYIGDNSRPGTLRTFVPQRGGAFDYYMRDVDGDGTGDLYVSLGQHGPDRISGWRSVRDVSGVETLEEFSVPWEPQELYCRGFIQRAHWKDVLRGELSWGAYAEYLVAEDHTGYLMIIANRPPEEARSFIRAEIDRMLGLIREAEAAGIEAK